MKNVTKLELMPVESTARTILTTCIFFSGLTGLLYEVVWVRLFTLVFGNTVYSAAAVLSAFMGGLGLGGWWFGRFIEKRKDGVMFYGIVEIIIGAYALVPVFLIHGLESLYPALYKMSGGSLAALVAIKAVTSIIVLIIPAFCMGATLPLLSKFFVSRGARFGGAISTLYGLNTLGAVTGAFITGFYLLAVMGIHDTLLMGMAINIGIGLLSLVQHRKITDFEKENPEPSPEPDEQAGVALDLETFTGTTAPAPAYLIPLVLAATFISGFLSMLIEVSWTRTLALVLGSSVYAFVLILITFLLGIALGSLAMGRYFKKRPDSAGRSGLSLLGLCFLGIALFSSFAFPSIQHVVFWFAKILSTIQNNYQLVLLLEFFISVLLLLPPTLFFGAAFPAAASIYASNKNTIASGLGKIYLWNTLGAIVGSTLTGFVLIPRAGVHATLSTGAYTALCAGVLLLLLGTGLSSVKRFASAAAVSALIIFAVSSWKWDRFMMSSGPFIYIDNITQSMSFDEFKKSQRSGVRMLFYRDGVACTVTVMQTLDGMTYLKVNGKTDASTSRDVPTQVFLSAMPLLIHPKPEKIAVIGMGSGMTAGAALRVKSIKRLDIVEIEPYVVEANKFFSKYNFNFSKDPRTRIHIEDGRNYMLTHEDKYDVIVSEPSNHWIAGVANLYSEDYFKIAAKRLNDGGVYCQWLQFYSMAPESLSMILATFQSVFPDTHMFLVLSDLFLVGSKTPLKIDAREIERRYNEYGLRQPLFSIGAKYTGLGLAAAHYIAGPEEVRRLSALGTINTDNHPYLEFAAPFEFFADSAKIFSMAQDSYPIDPLKRTGLDPATMSPKDYLNIATDMMFTRSAPPGIENILLNAAKDNGSVGLEALERLARFYDQKRLKLLSDAAYKKAIAAGADNDFKLNYAFFLCEQKDFAGASAVLDKIQGSYASNPFFFKARAQVASGLKQYEEAMRFFLKQASFEKNANEKSLAYYKAAISIKEFNPADKESVMGLLSEANKLQPLDPVIAREFAMALYENGRSGEALAVLSKHFINPVESVKISLLTMEIQRGMNNPERRK